MGCYERAHMFASILCHYLLVSFFAVKIIFDTLLECHVSLHTYVDRVVSTCIILTSCLGFVTTNKMKSSNTLDELKWCVLYLQFPSLQTVLNPIQTFFHLF
jgi:hypothetical protein